MKIGNGSVHACLRSHQNYIIFIPILTSENWSKYRSKDLPSLAKSTLTFFLVFSLLWSFAPFERSTFNQPSKLFIVLLSSVIRLGELHKIVKSFSNFLITIWQYFEPKFDKFYAVGQIYIVISGLILKNNLDIWSHCYWATPLSAFRQYKFVIFNPTRI